MPHHVSGISAEVIERARAGDQRAYETIVLAYATDLVRFASITLRRREGAEDVVQEVFLQLWMRRDRLPDIETLGPYLYRAVRNRGIDLLRSERTRDAYYPRLAEAFARDGSVASDDGGVGSRTMDDGQDIQDLLDDAMHTLTDRQRMVLMLRYEQGLTHAQVAEVLGISLRAAEQLAKRALLVLRQQMRA
jgi:RNA polymerase sigma-70 factor (ECF subfamily)